MGNQYRKNIFLFFFFLIFILSTSCSSVSKFYITLDVLRPAQVEFKEEARNLLIVNNTSVPVDTALHNDDSQPEIQKVSVNKDSLAFFCLNVLADEIRNREFFSSVQLISQNINNNTSPTEIKPIQYKQVNELSKKYNADVIISLDFIFTSNNLEEYFLENMGVYWVVLETQYESLWSIHYPNEIKVEPFMFRDTLYWEAESYFKKSAHEKLPSRREAALDGALLVGSNAADRFIPYWEEVERYFYSSKNKYVRNGIDSISVKNWEGAIEDWGKVLETTKNKSDKANAANNIAIAYEVLGDYNLAIEYLDKAIEAIDSSLSYDSERKFQFIAYKAELLRRKNDVELLDKQLSD